uniref:Global nitrogen transcriptional regulator n=1 Tax=Plocamium cartilagineum TaxID=31452 RepID=A0A1C9CHW4_PLOCA|nr:global nitrogen transcriptional regulator [Plocamium cartilagineum]AOM67983.1 global nitrogen transcriptional regulator [Plocamium cartilagineum]
MKWINNLSALKIPFYIYKLNINDSIIYIRNKHNQNKLNIILHGIIYVIKKFTNKEILTLAILTSNHNININNISLKHENYYYEAIAIQDTYIICFKWTDFISKQNFLHNTFINVIKSYQNTLYRYETMNQILKHKYIKNRIIQLILFLCIEFGKINNQGIYIPFKISQITIATLVGSNRVTVNKTINQLCNEMLISYCYQKKFI